jgi:Amt family ammonium transporter
MTKSTSPIPFILLGLFAVIGIFTPLVVDFDGSKVYNYADISWMLISAALVLLMTPGLSFLLWRYGGKEKCDLNNAAKLYCNWFDQRIVGSIWIWIGIRPYYWRS